MSSQVEKSARVAMLLTPAILMVAWAAHLIGTGAVLATLGALAMLAYRADRVGHAGLLAPAGVMLGLGGGLTAADMAGGAQTVWPVVAALFGLGLLLIHVAERAQVWALFFGAPLVVVGTGAMVVLLPAMLLLSLLAGLIVLGLARAQRGWQAPVAVLARAAARPRATTPSRARVANGR